MRYHLDARLNDSIILKYTGSSLLQDDGVCECFEKGCSGWDMALTCLSLFFTISLPVLFIICFLFSAIASYYKGKARKKEQQLLTVWIEEKHETRKYPLSNTASSLADLHSWVGLLAWLGWGWPWGWAGDITGDLPFPRTRYRHNVPLPPWLCQMLWRNQWGRGRLLRDSLNRAEEDFQATGDVITMCHNVWLPLWLWRGERGRGWIWGGLNQAPRLRRTFKQRIM